MNREELYHFGIMGQKWGIRRYQNEDGSLTEAGRDHYRKKYSKYSDKITNASLKEAKYTYKSQKAHSKYIKERRKYENSDEGTKERATHEKRANKYQGKEERYANKAEKSLERTNKFISKMDDYFSEVTVESLPQADVDKGLAYANYIMALNDSNNSVAQAVMYQLMSEATNDNLKRSR